MLVKVNARFHRKDKPRMDLDIAQIDSREGLLLFDNHVEMETTCVEVF